MSRPLVSVITPTIPARHDLLLECIENVQQQTYPNVEHLIISDGPDDQIRGIVDRWVCNRMAEADRRHPVDADPATVMMSRPRLAPIRFYQLGRHWTGELSGSYATAPIMVGQFLARGEYSCIWSDDERAMDPDHITKMVDLIEETGADFVYPIVEVWRKDEPDFRRLIWADPPVDGSITHWMYRVSMIEKAKGPYRTHIGRLGNDWDFISRAMAGGATWGMLPEITFEHRIDS
jgi:glycosyltransferase involved in cell wall biosynthesis